MPVARSRLLLSLFASLATPLALVAADPPAPPVPAEDVALAGLWESQDAIGRGAALWLASNGDAVWGTGMFADATYTVKGDRIGVRFESPLDEDEDEHTEEAPQEQPLGNLTHSRWMREGDGRTEVWERVGTSDRVTVEGTWTTMHKIGRTAYERYEPGGAMRLRIQVGPGLAGTWARKGDAVVVRWKDGTRSTLKVQGEALHVPTALAGEVVLTRRGAENWYALQQNPPEFSTGRTPQAGREVLGLWENTHKTLGGIGGAWWFEPSGRVVAATLFVGDATYERKDGRLLLRSSGSPKPDDVPLGDLGPDTWRIVGEGMTMTKVRVGPVADPPSVVGTWRYKHYTGGTAYERYGQDGTLQYRALITPAEVGTWSRNGDLLEVRWPQAPAARFRVQDGRLIDDESGTKEPYATRRGDEDWYGLATAWGPEPARAP